MQKIVPFLWFDKNTEEATAVGCIEVRPAADLMRKSMVVSVGAHEMVQ